MKLLRRTWANVDLDSIEKNYRAIRKHVPEQAKILGIVKADAYGHGAVPVSRALGEFGADYLAVSSLEEAMQLRRADIKMPLLILGYTPPQYASDLAYLRLTQEVHTIEYARALNLQLAGTGRILDVHVKIDTGMTRLGFDAREPEALEAAFSELLKLSHLRVSGAFTHFSSSDSLAPEDVAYTKTQYALFCDALDRMEAFGCRPEIRHCCNSGATILHPEFAMDMVRPGIILYGEHPSEDTKPYLSLEPAMSLHTLVSQIREVKAGTAVSYGRTFITPEDRKIAVLSIGYADGISRSLSGNLSFSIGGKLIPQVGRICMDMCMADATGADISVGDEATVFGASPALTAQELAARTGTIVYETLCIIGKRVPRIYFKGGSETDTLQYVG